MAALPAPPPGQVGCSVLDGSDSQLQGAARSPNNGESPDFKF